MYVHTYVRMYASMWLSGLRSSLFTVSPSLLFHPLFAVARYFCEVCDCIVKDSLNYLDHINGRKRKDTSYYRPF